MENSGRNQPKVVSIQGTSNKKSKNQNQQTPKSSDKKNSTAIDSELYDPKNRFKKSSQKKSMKN